MQHSTITYMLLDITMNNLETFNLRTIINNNYYKIDNQRKRENINSKEISVYIYVVH